MDDSKLNVESLCDTAHAPRMRPSDSLYEMARFGADCRDQMIQDCENKRDAWAAIKKGRRSLIKSQKDLEAQCETLLEDREQAMADPRANTVDIKATRDAVVAERNASKHEAEMLCNIRMEVPPPTNLGPTTMQDLERQLRNLPLKEVSRVGRLVAIVLDDAVQHNAQTFQLSQPPSANEGHERGRPLTYQPTGLQNGDRLSMTRVDPSSHESPGAEGSISALHTKDTADGGQLLRQQTLVGERGRGQS